MAIDIDWPSATIVNAKARPSSSDTEAQLTALRLGGTNCGHGAAMGPIVRIGKLAPAANAVAATKPISIKGQLGDK